MAGTSLKLAVRELQLDMGGGGCREGSTVNVELVYWLAHHGKGRAAAKVAVNVGARRHEATDACTSLWLTRVGKRNIRER
jgi:hypothetical protein